VDEVEMQFLYADGDSYYFMDTQNYEQTHLSKEILGDAVDYLIANLEIKVEFFDGKAVGIELPQTVILTVVETEPGLKSATASSVTKAAKTETGLVVQVPPFINEARKLRSIPRKARICPEHKSSRVILSVARTSQSEMSRSRRIPALHRIAAARPGTRQRIDVKVLAAPAEF